jgi:2-oxoglutarate dehydrogenase E2 component (dihydrolipoamide succinyltransferase)
MSKIELKMPKMGESVAEATIIKWVKNVGDMIEADETVVEIATDKVDSEIPSTTKGQLIKKLYNENDVVSVGETIAIIDDGKESDKDTNQNNSTDVSTNLNESDISYENKKIDIANESNTNANLDNEFDVSNSSKKFYSPLVKTIAKKEGISISELNTIEGSGHNQRVTKKDILIYIKNKVPKPSQSETSQEIIVNENKVESSIEIQNYEPSTDDSEIIEMDRMRKLISKHMTASKSISAHVTSFVESDVTDIVNWRIKNKNKFLEREKQKLTYTPIIFEAVIKAIVDFPMINISVSGDKIVKHKNINIGMATALPSGNLIVPVIKNAQEKNLLGLTKSVNDLANRARNNKLLPEEVMNGTFTITNVGSFGSVMGTPIINQPQVAILALGKIQKKPSVIETQYGDLIGIRSKMFLSLSYDHRVVDGALGGQFLKRVSDYLEKFDSKRDI